MAPRVQVDDPLFVQAFGRWVGTEMLILKNRRSIMTLKARITQLVQDAQMAELEDSV
jgi:hypothetical protein